VTNPKITQLIEPELMLKLNELAIRAHQVHPKKPENAVRKADLQTPYVTHCQWVASSIISEEKLPPVLRRLCYQALLLHDVIEDTTLELPDWVEPEVISLIEELTFAGGTKEEAEKIRERSQEAILCKLYDKVHSCLFGLGWLEPQYYHYFYDHITNLINYIEPKYGDLAIIGIAKVTLQKLKS
jgi:(p)ppGpp synthase/HD superfamily hydrolase